MAALYVSHDLAVVSTLAERVAVMYAGRLVEVGDSSELFANAAHPYTRRLVGAIPRLAGSRELIGIPGRAPSPGSRPQGCAFASRCAFVEDACRLELPPLRALGDGHMVRCLRVDAVRAKPMPFAGEAIAVSPPQGESVLSVQQLSAGYRGTTVLHDINLELAPRECLALVGESGSGKTTLARSIAGLHAERSGRIVLHGEELVELARHRSRESRRRLQYIFQNPYGSLNPRRTIDQIVRQPLEVFGIGGSEANAAGGRDAGARVADRPRTPRGIPISSPAASASGWRSPGPWCRARMC